MIHQSVFLNVFIVVRQRGSFSNFTSDCTTPLQIGYIQPIPGPVLCFQSPSLAALNSYCLQQPAAAPFQRWQFKGRKFQYDASEFPLVSRFWLVHLLGIFKYKISSAGGVQQFLLVCFPLVMPTGFPERRSPLANSLVTASALDSGNGVTPEISCCD